MHTFISEIDFLFNFVNKNLKIISIMNTAQILYEQFKVLPRRVKNELKTLIENEGDEYVDISLPAFKDAVKQVKLFKEIGRAHV